MKEGLIYSVNNSHGQTLNVFQLEKKIKYLQLKYTALINLYIVCK